MNAGRRFSQAISEGDGISLIAKVGAAEEAGRAEEQGAEAVLVTTGQAPSLDAVRAATTLPVLVLWATGGTDIPAGMDACVLDVGEDLEEVAELYHGLAEATEVALRIDDEEELESTLEELDPEIFVLAAPDADGEEALERVLDLLPDVPAGKLAIAELRDSGREEVGALERAGFDGVIVEARSVEELAGPPQPDAV